MEEIWVCRNKKPLCRWGQRGELSTLIEQQNMEIKFKVGRTWLFTTKQNLYTFNFRNPYLLIN